MQTRVFTKISNLLRKKGEVEQSPFGMRDGEISQLKVLRSSPEWQTYMALLDNVIMLKAEGLLNPANPHVEFTRGFIAGLRAAPGSVDLAIAQKESNDARRAERARTELAAERGAASSLYATPAFDTIGGRSRRSGA